MEIRAHDFLLRWNLSGLAVPVAFRLAGPGMMGCRLSIFLSVCGMIGTAQTPPVNKQPPDWRGHAVASMNMAAGIALSAGSPSGSCGESLSAERQKPSKWC
ncbi:hypothetical protein [uncultured Parasphingorhabdus sp.]|uniref:hypothetical protein n=1 Tax=uncultured Parasphingorhabdus sp. TaxID=2709694 RepID=UPI002AA7EFD3|nr:hypothetical protein [uncultured Parasphingorhabdus sp.]